MLRFKQEQIIAQGTYCPGCEVFIDGGEGGEGERCDTCGQDEILYVTIVHGRVSGDGTTIDP